jgi:hypothetical protein
MMKLSLKMTVKMQPQDLAAAAAVRAVAGILRAVAKRKQSMQYTGRSSNGE